MKLNPASPVQASPGGASPAAEGVGGMEGRPGPLRNPSAGSGTARGSRSAPPQAAPGPTPSASRSDGLNCSRAVFISQPRRRALSLFMITAWAASSAANCRRQREIADMGAGVGETASSALEQCGGLRRGTLPGRRAADADAWGRWRTHIGIAQVMPGHRAGEQGAVGHAAGHDADGVEAVRHQLHTVAVDQAKAGLVADDAAEKPSRTDDAARGLGAERDREEPARHPPPSRCWTPRASGLGHVGWWWGRACGWRTRL